MSREEDVESLSFEEALGRLEKLTGEVEAGTLPLARALDEFERGIRLAQRCRAILDSADGRIQKLTAEGKLEPFGVED